MFRGLLYGWRVLSSFAVVTVFLLVCKGGLVNFFFKCV